ncbi:hypothetical protein [Clostridium tyrobutyricum]|uniref:hypothetical protein n=1 Tax=Clostridium tyrobutyricum TaxID=1519 RepID=UPI001C38E2F7|nr:hypothetical protein [Clostridium tyrobutyricum]MBV4440221.1 hypothetical protein [Clostridium tyrobutyricum]
MNKNLCNKKEKYISVLSAFNNKIKHFINVLSKCEIEDGDSIQIIILKKYIEFNDTTKVADYLNEYGYRVATSSSIGRRKYNHNDISKVVTSRSAGSGTCLCGAVFEMKEIEKILRKINYKNLIKNNK